MYCSSHNCKSWIKSGWSFRIQPPVSPLAMVISRLPPACPGCTACVVWGLWYITSPKQTQACLRRQNAWLGLWAKYWTHYRWVCYLVIHFWQSIGYPHSCLGRHCWESVRPLPDDCLDCHFGTMTGQSGSLFVVKGRENYQLKITAIL